LIPVVTLARGAVEVATHPMESFLVNVEPVVRVYLATDVITNLAAIVILSLGLPHMDVAQRSLARPLRKAFFVMAPLSVLAFVLKIHWGFSGPGRYQWVILHDLIHLAAPAALVWACYRTESVALSVTRSGWRRAGWIAAAFAVYMVCKFLWPLSELDHLGAWTMASLGFAGTMGPMSMTAGRSRSNGSTGSWSTNPTSFRDSKPSSGLRTWPTTAFPRTSPVRWEGSSSAAPWCFPATTPGWCASSMPADGRRNRIPPSP
ncbi:MAG TPA: hypothetical protein PKY05_01555, partial [Fibrobacteria bacterium]|nr:hypothetical protein [Fibrobacteria bacterium]